MPNNPFHDFIAIGTFTEAWMPKAKNRNFVSLDDYYQMLRSRLTAETGSQAILETAVGGVAASNVHLAGNPIWCANEAFIQRFDYSCINTNIPTATLHAPQGIQVKLFRVGSHQRHREVQGGAKEWSQLLVEFQHLRNFKLFVLEITDQLLLHTVAAMKEDQNFITAAHQLIKLNREERKRLRNQIPDYD